MKANFPGIFLFSLAVLVGGFVAIPVVYCTVYVLFVIWRDLVLGAFS